MKEISDILQVERLIDGIELVVFDLDDTLYSEKEYVRSGFHKIAEALHMPELEAELWEAFSKRQKAIDVVFESRGMLDRKNEALSIYRNQKPAIHLYDGVREMLTRIRQRGKLLGLLTDGRPEGQRAKIEALEIGGVFDEIIITDELGGVECRKPNEMGFVRMHERTGVPYEKMAYVGDNINKDFVAPEKMNMRCIYCRSREGLYSKYY